MLHTSMCLSPCSVLEFEFSSECWRLTKFSTTRFIVCLIDFRMQAGFWTRNVERLIWFTDFAYSHQSNLCLLHPLGLIVVLLFGHLYVIFCNRL